MVLFTSGIDAYVTSINIHTWYVLGQNLTREGNTSLKKQKITIYILLLMGKVQ